MSMSTDGQNEHSSRVKVIAVVATAGLVSAALGFAAEVTKVQLAEVQDLERGCTYPRHASSTYLAIIAVATLLGFRVYCPGIRSPSSMIQLSRYLSWMASFVALIFYIVGLLMMKNQGQKVTYQDIQSYNYYECNVVKPGIFGAGASFALASVVLELMYMVVTEHRSDQKTTTDPSPRPSVFAMC